MPKLDKYFPGHHGDPVLCSYNPERKGFSIYSGGETDWLRAKLSSFAKPKGYTSKGMEWFVPEVFWVRVKELGKALGNREFLQGLQQFHAHVTVREKYNHILGYCAFTPMGTRLRDYQRQAVTRLLTGDLLLGDDMGLGKTLSVLCAWHMLLNGKKVQQLVVFVPNDDVGQEWINALKTHFGGGNAMLIRDRRQLGKDAAIILIPYTKIFRPDYCSYLRNLCSSERTVLVMDEAHKVSAPDSKQHRAALEYSKNVGWVWLLTGSEVRDPSLYYGLYKIVRRLDPVSDGMSYDTWCKYYCAKGGRGWNQDRLKELNILRNSFALRRVKEDVCQELPPLTFVRRPVPMHPLQEQLYRQMEKEKECEIVAEYGSKELSENHFFTVYLRLMQLASHPLLLEETRITTSPKVDALLDILEGVGDQKVLVWSNWPKTIDHIHDSIRSKLPYLRISKAHGGVSKTDRNTAKEALQSGNLDVIIANPCIWGEGVNLQAASVMVYFDYHPSSTRWEQSKSRAHRMGQTKAVTAYLLYHPNSIETRIMDWLQTKRRLSAIITGGK